MEFINPKAELLQQTSGIEGVYKMIEIAGRTCYKSKPREEVTSKQFVDSLIKSGHLSPLEHGTIYLSIYVSSPIVDQDYIYKMDLVSFFDSNKYSIVRCEERTNNLGDVPTAYTAYRITTNYRVIVEHEDKVKGWENFMEPHYLTVFEKRYTFRITTSIGISREINRHRTFSICEQSTRYCNYSKDKFNNEVSFITPNIDDRTNKDLCKFYQDAEALYLDLVNNGVSPQFVRNVLPLGTATEAVYTAFESDWKHFLDLRLKGTTGKPHPDMINLAEQISNIIL